MKKQIAIVILGMVFVTMACALGAAPTQPQTDEVSTVVAETMQSFTAVPTQVRGTPFSFKNVSFVIPEGIAGGANAEVVPAATEEQGGPWGMGPEHISIELSGYVALNENEALKNKIEIYPAKEYMDANWGAAKSIPQLQAILADPSMQITADNAPSVPSYNAGKLIAAQTKMVNFKNGSGVRLITEYAQYFAPITKNGEIYQYAGLTNDGKYFILVVLPIQTPLLSTADNPSADGVAYPDMATADEAAFNAYYQAVTDKLNSSDPNSFLPTLAQLDALIESIEIAP